MDKRPTPADRPPRSETRGGFPGRTLAGSFGSGDEQSLRRLDRRSLLLLGPLLGACSSVDWTVGIGPELRTVLVLTKVGEAWSGTAYDSTRYPEGRRFRSEELFPGASAYELVILGYRADLQALGLSEGELQLVQSGEPLPIPERRWGGRAGQPRLDPDWPLAEVMSLRLPDQASRCLARGSCFGLADTICQPSCAVDVEPPPPRSPALPVFTPCPPGWLISLDDPALGPGCEPWPGPLPEDCSGAQMVTPGDPRCRGVGAPCPVSGFASGLPPATIYVDANAGPGGVGSAAAPLRTLAEAEALLSAGGTLALAPGRYPGSIALPAGASLVGACAAGTTLVPQGGDGVTLTDGGSVRDLSVEGGAVGVAVRHGTARLRGLLITGSRGVGLLVAEGSASTIDDCRVRGSLDRGIWVQNATVSIAKTTVVDSVGEGIVASASGLSLADVAIAGVVGRGGMDPGEGLLLMNAKAGVDRLVIERTQGTGLFAIASELSARDLVVREVADTIDPGGGVLLDATVARLERVSVDGVPLNGYRVRTGSRLTGVDLTARAVRTLSSQDSGAVDVTGSEVTLSRFAFHGVSSGFVLGKAEGAATASVSDATMIGDAALIDSHASGLFCAGAQTRFSGTRLAIALFPSGIRLDDRARAEVSEVQVERSLSGMGTRGIGSRGLAVYLAAELTISRAIVERSQLAGVWLEGEGSSLIATDILIGDARPCADCANFVTATGVVMGLATKLSLERFALRSINGIGLDLGANSAVRLQHGVVTKAQVGARFGPHLPPALLLHQVRFFGNEQDWERVP